MRGGLLAPGSTAAFGHRNFRLYWTAQLISLMGTFMQQVALGYLIYDLTGSKWLLGAISALTMGPSLLLSLPAGVLADRVPRRRLVLCTQSGALLLAFILATLTALHRLEVWEILVLSTLSGIAIAIESPARQALVADLVGGKDLPNAIGWNSLMNFNVLMPVIAHDTLHTGPTGLGWMWTAMGLGAVGGSMTVVIWSRAAVAGPMLLVVALVSSASTAALAVTSAMPAALAILLIIGWSTGAFFASASSAIQHRVTDRVRGRVLSVYSMIFAGTTPLGGLFVAGIASAGGVSLALAAAGGVSLLIGTALALPVLHTLETPPLATASAAVLDRPAS